jgi:hypothetical protein
MALAFKLTTLCDLFAKLQRDASALDDGVSSDRFFNFVVTGYSMIDWVKNDPSVPKAAKASVNLLYQNQYLKVCGELANACKHFSLTKRDPITETASSFSGFGMGRFGKGSYGEGEEQIIVQLNDGSTYICSDLVRGVVECWQQFFIEHGI